MGRAGRGGNPIRFSGAEGVKTEFIAEVSSNHGRDLARSHAFIDAAADLGCSAVKFQMFKIDELFAPEILAKSQTHRDRAAWEFPAAFVPELAAHCRERGIAFACTPFYLDAVEILEPYVDFYKIASYELLWHDLIKACAETGKPVTLSSGMATLSEVGAGVEAARRAGCRDLSLMHCVSNYPTAPENCNLAAIETMRRAFDCPVGWSDHSANRDVLIRAIHRWQAAAVEFHLDLDGTGAEFAPGHCWLPEDIADIIAGLNVGLIADGEGIKEPRPVEMHERQWRADPSDGLRPFKAVRDGF